tara:strand:+ start:223 stop:582 length:360 start_codon:yes stop_codon:yes gene_type:complete
MLAGITQILGSVGSLATSYMDGKVQTQKIKAEIQKKQLTGEIDWDLEAIKATQSSWKDEYILILYSIPLILAFCGETGRQIVTNGFQALEAMPLYYQVSLGGIVSASIGFRGISKFYGK